MHASLATFVSMALFLMMKGSSLRGRGPGPPARQSNQLAYIMDVNPVHPYQVPVYYMRRLLGQLESRPRDINFFLELAREPNGFLDILDNYQHGISMVIQLGNALLAVVAIGGVVVVGARWAGYCGGDETAEEVTPYYKTTYTIIMSVTLFLAAIDFVLAFLLYQSSGDLSASIEALPMVKDMAARDLAAFVTNTINQKLEAAERKKKRRLEELEDDFQNAFSHFLKTRMHDDLKLRNIVNVSDCANSVREIGILFVKDGAQAQGRRLLRASKSLARVRDYQERLCNLVSSRVAKTTAKDRNQVVQKLKKELHESAHSNAQEELKETLNGLDRAFNRLMAYGSKTGWWDRFRSTTLFSFVPFFFLLILAVIVPFTVAAMTQHNFDEDPTERNIRSHVSGIALIYCAAFLFVFVVLALYVALQIFPYGAVGECYLCNSYRQGSFKVLNMLAVRLWPLNERSSMFRGIHPSEVLSKCSHGDATLADLGIPAEVRQDMDAVPRSTRVPLLDSEPYKLAQKMPSFLVHDRQVAMLPVEDINVTAFVKALRTSLSRERTLTEGTRRKASTFLQKWDQLDLKDATERLAATSYRRMLLTMLPKYYEEYLHGPRMDRHIGNCGPVYNVIDKTMSATCDGFVDSLLAFVFLLVVAAAVSTLLAVMAAKGGKKGKKKKKKKKGKAKKGKKGKKGKKKKAKKAKKKPKKAAKKSSESTSSSSKAPTETKTTTPPPEKKTSEDTVIRITTTRTGDSPAGSVDQTEFLEIRLPNQEQFAPPPPPVLIPARTPTHTVETLHIQIPQQQQQMQPTFVAPPPPQRETSTIEIRLPSKLMQAKQPQPVITAVPVGKRQVQRVVSLNVAGPQNVISAPRRSASLVQLSPRRQLLWRQPSGQSTLPWPWNMWYPYMGGVRTAARTASLVTESSSSVEIVERAQVPTSVRRVHSGPLVTRGVLGSLPYGSMYPYYAYPHAW